jgi:RimJ/RimL family protein N-acetyltransferase
MEKVLLTGEKVHLRDWIVADLDAYAFWLQPGHRWQELDGPYFAKTRSEEIPNVVARIKARIEADNFAAPRQNLIIADPDSNRFIGQVSRYWISEETHWLAAGIVIHDSNLWSRGYGANALGLWTSYLFDHFPSIVRLDLQTWSGNIGMMRLANKLGYQLEGRFRQARIVLDKHYDALGYGILREEWQQYRR